MTIAPSIGGALQPVSTSAPAPTPPGDPTQQLAQQAISAEQALPKTLSDITGRGEAAIAKLEDDKATLQPPKFEPPPPPTPQTTNPQQAWASSAMILAAFGSLFTRAPLTTAMNAAAKVLTAYRQNDQNAANYAFETWKVANDNYQKAFAYEMDMYKLAVGDLEHREDLVMKMTEQERSDASAAVDAYAHAFNDSVMLAQKGFEDKLKVMQFREQQYRNNALATEHNIQEHAVMQAVQAYDDEHKGEPVTKASVMARANFIGQAMAAVSHSLTPAQADNQIKSMASNIAKSDLGKAYSAGIRNYQTVEAWPDGGGVIPQAALQDAYTQIINGGRAIRGFQAKMNTEHAGLFDKAEIAFQQAFKHGGSLSPQMIADIKELSAQIFRERASAFQGAIQEGKDAADALGLDSATMEKEVYSITGKLDLPGANAPPEAVNLLKQHANDPTYRASFDKHFGVGAAAAVLGQ